MEQIVAAVKQHELDTLVADTLRNLGITEQTFYRRKKPYGGLEPGQARELKQLRKENIRLKKVVTDLNLDKAILQDIAAKANKNSSGSRQAAKLAKRYL